MTEKTLRNWHRRTGVVFALFILLQSATGLLLTFEEAPFGEDRETGYERNEEKEDAEVESFELLEAIHRGGELPGFLYRLVVALGALNMVFTGGWIFVKIRVRAVHQERK